MRSGALRAGRRTQRRRAGADGRPDDVVIVHDPQPAGMVPALARLRRARDLALPHRPRRDQRGGRARLAASSRPTCAMRPPTCSRARPTCRRSSTPAAPRSSRRASIRSRRRTSRSTRSRARDPGADRAHRGPRRSRCGTLFVREDGTPGRVDRVRRRRARWRAAVVGTTPLVVQVSRWDRLKDPIGVLAGFARLDAARRAARTWCSPGPTLARRRRRSRRRQRARRGRRGAGARCRTTRAGASTWRRCPPPTSTRTPRSSTRCSATPR